MSGVHGDFFVQGVGKGGYGFSYLTALPNPRHAQRYT